MIVAGGLAGFGFVGADVPGFYGTPPTDVTIAAYQLGVFYPFFRAHSHLDNKRREPWKYSQQVQTVIREAIFLRYSLIHVVYNLFCEYTCRGTPLIRPVWMEFPTEEATFSTTNRFMFGPDIFVAPKMTRDLLYDQSDPDEMFGKGSSRTYDRFNVFDVVLPGSPKVFGGHDHVLWYDFQTSQL